MNTLTIKVPSSLERELVQWSQQAHLSKSEVVRRALVAFLAQRQAGSSFVSALDRAGDLVGCFDGAPADLASNPKYLEGFGQV